MIYVLASIRVKPGLRDKFLEIFNSNIPEVRKEKGCIEYFPTVDLETGLPPQMVDDNVVTILERWESPEALQDHLTAPHMLAYKEKVIDIVEEVSLKVLKKV